MKYSFTKPNKKTFIQYDTRIWLTFIIVMSSIIIGFNLFIQAKYTQTSDRLAKNKASQERRITHINTLKATITEVESKIRIYENINVNNMIFKDSIKNLFDLIPSQIVLHSVTLRENELYIKGHTPSKQIYTYMLDNPLKSLFNSSKVSFYLRKDGMYSFLSVNKFDQLKKEKKEDDD